MKNSDEEFIPERGDLAREMAALFNKYNCENVSGTPDFVLAEVALDAVKSFNESVHKRAEFRGESVTFKPELDEPLEAPLSDADLLARAKYVDDCILSGKLPPKDDNGFYILDFPKSTK